MPEKMGFAARWEQLPTSVRKAVRRACRDRGAEPADVLSKSRGASATEARRQAMAELYRRRNAAGARVYTSTVLARHFRRHHSTVMRALRLAGAMDV